MLQHVAVTLINTNREHGKQEKIMMKTTFMALTELESN